MSRNEEEAVTLTPCIRCGVSTGDEDVEICAGCGNEFYVCEECVNADEIGSYCAYYNHMLAKED